MLSYPPTERDEEPEISVRCRMFLGRCAGHDEDARLTSVEAYQLLHQVRRVREIGWHLLVDSPGVDSHPFDGVKDC